MENTISIEYPSSLAVSLRLSDKEFREEVKTSSLVKLFELGKISSGVAANVLGISRLEFLELIAKYNVSIYNQSDIQEIYQDSLHA